MFKVTLMLIALVAIVVPSCRAQEPLEKESSDVIDFENLFEAVAEDGGKADITEKAPCPCACSQSDKRQVEQVIDLTSKSTKSDKTKKSGKKQKSITIKVSLDDEIEPESEAKAESEPEASSEVKAKTSAEYKQASGSTEGLNVPKKNVKVYVTNQRGRSKRDVAGKSSKKEPGKEKSSRKSSKGKGKK